VDDAREAMYKERIKEMESHISTLERVLKLMQVINSTLELSPLLDLALKKASRCSGNLNTLISRSPYIRATRKCR